MLTSLCAEVRIKERLLALNTTVQFLASLAGISNVRLSEALRGLKDLENPLAARLLELTRRMLEIQDAFSPLPIAWRNPKDAQWLLTNLTRPPEEIKQMMLTLF